MAENGSQRAPTDEEVEAELKYLADRERHNLVKLLTCFGEFDRRKLFVARGYRSAFEYACLVLKMDEGAAFRRLRAARLLRRWPDVGDLVERGGLHLAGLNLLQPVLTELNRKELLALSAGKNRREIETIVAERFPAAPIHDHWRRHSAAPPASEPMGGRSPWQWQAIVPTALGRVRIGFDAAAAVVELIHRSRQILRHKYPAGRLEDLVRDAFETFLDRKDPQRRLALGSDGRAGRGKQQSAPASSNDRVAALRRYIPAWVKRAVWEREGGRCSWRDADGTVCGSKDWIEYDHLRPVANGGRSDSPRNIRLLCRRHNVTAANAAGLNWEGAAGERKGDDSSADSPADGRE